MMTSGRVSDANAAELVGEITPLIATPVDDKLRERAAKDKSTAVKTVVTAWKQQQVEERKMRSN